MTIEPVASSISTKTVRPKPDADDAGSDGHARRDGGNKQGKEEPHADAHPVPNDQGQMTGKLIDIKA